MINYATLTRDAVHENKGIVLCNTCSKEHACFDIYDKALTPFLNVCTFVSCCGGQMQARVNREMV